VSCHQYRRQGRSGSRVDTLILVTIAEIERPEFLDSTKGMNL
jgi:hypothetical protein